MHSPLLKHSLLAVIPFFSFACNYTMGFQHGDYDVQQMSKGIYVLFLKHKQGHVLGFSFAIMKMSLGLTTWLLPWSFSNRWRWNEHCATSGDICRLYNSGDSSTVYIVFAGSFETCEREASGYVAPGRSLLIFNVSWVAWLNVVIQLRKQRC